MPDAIITCPFCGLVCDDLRVLGDDIDTRGCPKAAKGFAQAVNAERKPHAIAGRPASFDEAAAAAARILMQSAQTMIGGLSADLQGIRTLLALADRIGAIVDHRNSAALLANASVARTSGWVTSTFAEVANRTDYILIVGEDPTPSFPRFFERLVGNANALYREQKPVVDFLGDLDAIPEHGLVRNRITVPKADLMDAIALFGAIVAGHIPRSVENSRVPVSALTDIAEGLRAAQYGVIVWDATSFPAGQAELVVEIIARVLRVLNRTTRCVGLPLGGGEHGVGAMQVMLWQTGWPMRVSFGGGVPTHDPWAYDGFRLLDAGEVDALIWVAALAPEPPPRTRIPTIALIADDIALPGSAAVEIRVGVPAIDHRGTMVRADTVIALPLSAAKPTDRPSIAAAAAAILRHLDLEEAAS